MTPEQIDALNKALKDLTEQVKNDTTERQRASRSSPNTGAADNSPQRRENFTRLADAASSYSSTMDRIEEQNKRQQLALEDQMSVLEDRQALQELHQKGLLDSIDTIEEGLKKRKAAHQEEINALFAKKRIEGDLSKSDQAALENLVRSNKVIERNLDFAKMTLEEKGKTLLADTASARIAKTTKEIEEQRLATAKESGQIVANTMESLASTVKLKADPKRGVAGFLRAIVFDADARESALDNFKNKVEKFKGLATKANLLGAAFEFVANALGSIVTLGFKGLIRVLQAVMEGIVGAVLLFDKLGANIAKVTGHGREFAKQYTDVAGTLDATGTHLQEQVEMMVELGSGLRGVGGMSIKTMGDFANLGITAKRLGMDMSDLTEITKFQTVGLGRSADQVKESISNLNVAASTMGMDFSDLSKQFASTQGTFAAFGQSSEKTFLRTASMARQLGVELGDIVQISDQFKTFDSAATSVANLNFIMGGQFLDTLELMQLRATEGPEAVVQRIKDSFDATGKSFEDMSFHEQEALAEAAGLSVDKARNLFMGKTQEDQMTAVEQATQSFNEFSKRGRETMTIMERIGKIALSVGMQLAKAFGFDKFATGKAEDLLKNFEDFAKEDLVGKLVPVIRNDIMPAVIGLAKFLKGFANSPIARFFMDDDDSAESEEKEKKKAFAAQAKMVNSQPWNRSEASPENATAKPATSPEPTIAQNEGAAFSQSIIDREFGTETPAPAKVPVKPTASLGTNITKKAIAKQPPPKKATAKPAASLGTNIAKKAIKKQPSAKTVAATTAASLSSNLSTKEIEKVKSETKKLGMKPITDEELESAEEEYVNYRDDPRYISAFDKIHDKNSKYAKSRLLQSNARSKLMRLGMAGNWDKISKFQAGGPVLEGGVAIVGEKGPEMVSLPRGAYVTPNDSFSRAGAPHSKDTTPSDKQKDVQVNVSINVDDRKLKDIFSTTVKQVLVGH
jgi:hypothetical protein